MSTHVQDDDIVADARQRGALAERVKIVAEIRRYADKIRGEAYTPSVGVAMGAIVDSVADMVNTLPDPEARFATSNDPCPVCGLDDGRHDLAQHGNFTTFLEAR